MILSQYNRDRWQLTCEYFFCSKHQSKKDLLVWNKIAMAQKTLLEIITLLPSCQNEWLKCNDSISQTSPTLAHVFLKQRQQSYISVAYKNTKTYGKM